MTAADSGTPGTDPPNPGTEGDTDVEETTGIAYRAVLVAIVILGGIAVAVGVGGTIVVLSGGSDTDENADVLGQFTCDSFDADPQVVHETEYQVETTVLNPTQVSQFDGTVDGEQTSVSLTTAGPMLAASATTPRGKPVPVETTGDKLSINRNTTEPFRLWVDSVSAEGTVTRMQLDVCPPA